MSAQSRGCGPAPDAPCCRTGDVGSGAQGCELGECQGTTRSHLGAHEVHELYYPTVETYPFLPPLEIVWLPKAQVKTQYINPDSTHVTDQLKLFFAPNTRYLHIDSYSSIIVISEKATDVAVGVTRQSYLDNVYPTIIAPKGSAAWSQWQYSDEDPIKYIDSDSIIEAKGAQIRTRDNGLRFGFVLDESEIGRAHV